MEQKITLEEISSFENDLKNFSDLNLKKATVMKNGIVGSSTAIELEREMKFAFSVDVESGNVTNQKRSGRCWMFSGLNVLRTILYKKLNVKNIELSQAYLQFYDKLEKANFFLEKAIQFASEEVKSRNNVFLLDSTIQDGGHFVMFSNLVKKYGVVPLEEMPDHAVSSETMELNTVLSSYLSQAMKDLRAMVKEGKSTEEINVKKKDVLSAIYRILTISLGSPVSSFEYEYVDKDNHYVRLKRMTPKEFYDEYIKEDLEDYLPLCDAPLGHMKPLTRYTCDMVNNVVGGSPIIFFNVPLQEMKKSVIASLKAGMPVWFAADVSSQSLRKEGYLVDGILLQNELFSLENHMDKASRMDYRSSFCNHAMTFTGVNLDGEGKSNRWKVENSWGKENGKDGYYVMSDKWFDEYVYQVFVKKEYVNPEIVDAYQKSALESVDPFDTLWAMMK